MILDINKNKYYDIKTYFKAIMIFWFLILVGLVFYSNNKINHNVEEQLGNRVTVLATYIANTLELSDEDIIYLKSLSFEELLKDEINQKFEKNIRAITEISDYKYIYLVSRLDKEQTIDGNNVMYILNAVDTIETRIEDAKTVSCYNNELRYNKADELFEKVDETKIPSYRIAKTEYEEYIYGYAPFYTIEGSYIGLIGVELPANTSKNIIKNYMDIIIFFMVINLVMGSTAFFMYKHMKSISIQLENEKFISGIDHLTHVFNRRKFNEIFNDLWESAKAKKEELSLILIDLDYFKEFNDNYGHITGDSLLKAIGLVLKTKTEPLDGHVCRYGGDEFVILFPRLDINQGEIVANEILEEINNLRLTHEYSPIDKYQTVSIGVASIIPTNEMTADDLLNQADSALYLSKRYGRNRVSIWNK